VVKNWGIDEVWLRPSGCAVLLGSRIFAGREGLSVAAQTDT
jgi:hypothetical protein